MSNAELENTEEDSKQMVSILKSVIPPKQFNELLDNKIAMAQKESLQEIKNQTFALVAKTGESINAGKKIFQFELEKKNRQHWTLIMKHANDYLATIGYKILVGDTTGVDTVATEGRMTHSIYIYTN
jgi:hypothetical protein